MVHQNVPTVLLTGNLPPLVSRETRITEPLGVEYITCEKPVYTGKLMTQLVSESAIDSRYLSTRDEPGYICVNQDFVAKLTRPPVSKSAIHSTEIFIDLR